MEETTEDSLIHKEEDTFKILVATDNHLGYYEKDPVRGNDTFDTFEEILSIAVREDVDFVLLGGDLFHETRPSPYCIFKCSELIRKYCLGDKAVEIEFLSDQLNNFKHTAMPVVNYEDPNLNVSIPIFSIHGNHDDPTGQKQISALDLMASTGFVNYFGRSDDITKVNIEPILLRKGKSCLALYGLSHIRDERLCRLFLNSNVTMHVPDNEDNWFNLLVWHQNRVGNRGVKNYIPDTAIPEFMDLAIWGHEHDCKIEPMIANKVFISQPGSSVATSLSAGESIPKKIGLLRIHEKEFDMTPIELKTVRPLIYDELILELGQAQSSKNQPLTFEDEAIKHVEKKIDEMIVKAQNMDRRADLIPLIRLNVKYRDERQVFNAIRFGQKYVGKVANPEDIVKFMITRNVTANRSKKIDGDSSVDEIIENNEESVAELVAKCFENGEHLQVLSLNGLNEALKKSIECNDLDAPILLIESQMKKTLEKLEELQPDVENIEQCLESLRIAREGRNDTDEVNQILNNPNRGRPKKSDDSAEKSNDRDDLDTSTGEPPAKRGRGGRGSRGGRATTIRRARGGRARAAPLPFL